MPISYSVVNETGNRNWILEMCKFQFWLVHWIDPRSIEHSYACCHSSLSSRRCDSFVQWATPFHQEFSGGWRKDKVNGWFVVVVVSVFVSFTALTLSLSIWPVNNLLHKSQAIHPNSSCRSSHRCDSSFVQQAAPWDLWSRLFTGQMLNNSVKAVKETKTLTTTTTNHPHPPLFSHSSSSCIGSRFVNGLTTSWLSWRTRSTTPPHRSTSAVTSNLSSSLVGFALLLRHESANRLPEPTSPTVLFAAPLLLFGIH